MRPKWLLAAASVVAAVACGEVLPVDDDAGPGGPSSADAGDGSAPSPGDEGSTGSGGAALPRCASVPVEAIAFVSSVTVPGTFEGSSGGADGLSKLCTDLAYDAGIPRRFVAAVGRTGEYFTYEGPSKGLDKKVRVRPDGQQIYESHRLPPDVPQVAIEVTERCTVVDDDAGVWTGYTPVFGSEHCSSWNTTDGTKEGHFGDPHATNGTFISGQKGPCSVRRHVYCFEP